MLATDSVALGDVRVHDSGYLEAVARTARTGVQQYLGSEMGRPELGMVNVYRDASVVFAKTSLQSFAKIPITVGHPPKSVTADTWKDVAVGTTGEEVLRDGETLKIGLKIMDADAVGSVKAGARELSVGYTTDIVWEEGTAPDGTPYQARQTNIIADHIAIVTAGRAGSQCRIGDSWPVLDDGGQRDPGAQIDTRAHKETEMQKHLIGDNAVEMSDAAIVAVKALQTDHAKLTTTHDQLVRDHAKLQADHAAAVKAKDDELAVAKKATETKDGEIAALNQKLKDAELTPAKLDAAVVARAKVIGDAKKVAGDKMTFDGKTDAQIRREAVEARLGDVAKTLSDDAINGAFLSYAADAKADDPLRRVISSGVRSSDAALQDEADAYADSIASLNPKKDAA
jgi:hypothetical protein